MDTKYSHMRKPNSFMHTSKEFKELRKSFQGINSTRKGSFEKSVRRHNSKAKALNKYKK